jgi:signal transduction histidine kinase/ActR/RegA family two-component response regulator
MKKWSSYSLQAKLTVVMTAIAVSTLLVSLVVASVRSISQFQVNMTEQVEGFVEVMAHNLGPILAFGNIREGEDMLTALAGQPYFMQAEVFLMSHGAVGATPFATYGSEESAIELPPLTAGRVNGAGVVIITRPVMHQGEQFGWLQLVLSREPVYREIRNQVISALALLLLSAVCAYFLAKHFARTISRPIDHLVDVAGSVTEAHDYSQRTRQFQQAELNALSEAFNGMLGQIQERDVELTDTHAALELQVRQLDKKNRSLQETRQRELELKDKLERAQRMESLGVLAGGVAHDLNNILGPIVAYPDLILDELRDADPIRDDLIQIQDAANKAKSVVQDLLTLGRRGNYQFEPMRLNDVVVSYLHSASFTQLQDASPELVLQQYLCDKIWPVKASASHLNQVIMNLVINAVEAMHGAGLLSINTRNITLHRGRVGFEYIPAGDYVLLSVADDGEGVPAEFVEHIFEPFFTRKKMGSSGSGLGLAVVYGVAKDHEALVDIETSEGKGTTFKFYFPRVDQPVRHRLYDLEPTGGNERILIVDDVEAQRKLATRILHDLGYEVSSVCGGREAIAFLSKNSADLVVLDMIMEEGFDGLDTYRGIREINEEQKCIIVSGYSENERIQTALALGVGDFVTKPYSRMELGHAVRTQLDDPSAVSSAEQLSKGQ